MPRDGGAARVVTGNQGGQTRDTTSNSYPHAQDNISHGARQGSGGPVHVSGRVVGVVRDGIFHKHVKGSVHMLRVPRAWAFDCTSLDQAEDLGAHSVAVHDDESGQVYTASLTLIRSKGIAVRRGYGDQVALALELWAVSAGGAAMQLVLGGLGL